MMTPSPRVGNGGGIGIGGGGDYASAEQHGETDKRQLHGWMMTEVIMLLDEGMCCCDRRKLAVRMLMREIAVKEEKESTRLIPVGSAQSDQITPFRQIPLDVPQRRSHHAISRTQRHRFDVS